MNDIVLFLVVIAAIVLVGLCVWNRMEANKAGDSQAVKLATQTTKGIYENLRAKTKPKKQENEVRVELVGETSDEPKPEVVTVENQPETETKPSVEVKDNDMVVAFEAETQPVAKPVAVEVVATPKPTVSKEHKPTQEVLPFTKDDEEPAEEDKGDEVIPSMPFVPKEGLKHFPVDPLSETVGTIHASKPILGGFMLEMANNLKKLNLPIRIYVRRSDNKRWYAPSNEGMYTEMAVVLLLANRLMVINELDASRFAMGVQQVGIALDADSETESTMSIIERAKRLYDNVKQLDVQLSVVLAARSAVTTSDVSEAARLAGFTQLNTNRYVFGSAKHITEATIFLRHDEFDLRYLYLLLDAPLALPNNKPLHQFFSVANDLCSRLDMELQDSKGSPINTAAAQMIFRQLNDYYRQMTEAQIEPGSAQARMLFTREG